MKQSREALLFSKIRAGLFLSGRGIFLFVFVFLMVAGAGSYLELSPIQTNMALDEHHWRRPPDLVVFRGKQNKKPVYAIYRVKDAGKQILFHSLKVDFFSPVGLFVYGFVPDQDGNETQRLYYVFEKGIHVYKLPEAFPSIASVVMNPKRTYLVIKNQGGGYCVAENQTRDELVCRPLDEVLPKDFDWRPKEVVWEPNQDRLLRIKAVLKDEVVYFDYDPWRSAAVESEAPLVLEKTKKNTRFLSIGPMGDTFYNRFLFWVRVVNGAGGKSYVRRLPTRAQLYWLNDGYHLLITNQGENLIWDITSNRISPFISGLEVDEVLLFDHHTL